MTAIAISGRPWWSMLVRLATELRRGWTQAVSERPLHPYHTVHLGM